MLKTFKYRLNPSKKQVLLLDKHIGASRFIYNLALETKQTAWAGNRVNLSCFDLIKQLPDLKKECVWLKDINSQSLQQPIRNLDNSFTRFFKGQGDFPKFKKKSNAGSFNVPQNASIENSRLHIPKFKKGLSIILDRPMSGVIRQVTISKTATGKYFAAILCETSDFTKHKVSIDESTTVGIDLGIKTYLVTSDGLKIDNPKHLSKGMDKLKYIQRKFSKNKGKRTKQKLTVLHEKILNRRKDFLHKTSTKLIRENQSLAIETLSVSNMLKNHNLAAYIVDASWGIFVTMLEYKAEWYGKNILRIGTFQPSSKTCSCCGKINKGLTLQDRKWTCVCGAVLDRDINAAINIKNFALKKHLSVGHGLKNRNELPTLVGVLTSETR